jgi:CheY-like chemotaxis protein
MVLESQPFDLRSCIEESLDLVAARAAEKGLELVYFIEEDVPEMVLGDVTRLRQILVNLLGNAVKFTERGEVAVSVDASPLGPGSVEVHFSVKDTGIGISEGNMGSLFQSFSQVDSSTTRNYGGTGLGLAISKRLVELMGGAIGVESEPGSGSTFSFTVPAKVFGPKEPSQRKDAALIGKRLVVVDDSQTARLMLMKSACRWGMEITEATSGLEALNILESGLKFDAALIDAVMPDMSGIALAGKLKEIREKDKDKDIPIILMSPFGHSRLQDTPFAGMLTKPIKPLQLHKILVDLFSPPSDVDSKRDRKTALSITAEERSHSLRILLAEDNAVNQKVALSMLRRLGYRADVAANGREVLQALERLPYDVVLMDVQMPEMDGLEATCCIRNRESASKQPWIIAMTAYALEGDKEECFRAGMNEYISKPVKIAELQEALDRRSAAVGEKIS